MKSQQTEDTTFCECKQSVLQLTEGDSEMERVGALLWLSWDSASPHGGC